MATRGDHIGRPFSNRQNLYLLLGLLAIIPVVAFAFGLLESDSFGLRGPGGPILAFSAGLFSFASPCVLPLVPVYITHLSGASIVNGRVVADRRLTFTHALVFVAGFSTVFIVLGTAVGLLGSYFFTDNQRELQQIAGIILVVMGILLIPSYGIRSPLKSALLLLALTAVYFALINLADLRDDRLRTLELAGVMALVWLRFSGYLPLTIFARTFEVQAANDRPVGYARSGVLGAAWALGWTPCIGPILASILTLASTSSEAWQGTYLLVAYSAGLAVPFLITGLLLSDIQPALRRLQRYSGIIEVVSGVMLISIGVLLLTGRLTSLNEYFGFTGVDQGL